MDTVTTHRRERILAVALLTALVTFAILGGLMFATADGHDRCIAATAQGIPCPASGIASALFHASFLKTFTDVAIPSAAAAMLFALALAAAAARARFFLSEPPVPFARAASVAGLPPVPAVSQFTQWLALHTNSPGARR